MTFAYLILAHKNPGQLRDLVNTLQDGDNYFFIHIDKKVQIEPFLNQSYFQPGKIFFCRNRVNANWGGFSLVQATMNLIRSVPDNNITPDYVHLISGSDFPIKKNTDIKRFFISNNGQNFLEHFTFPVSHGGWGGMDRIRFRYNVDTLGQKKAILFAEEQRKLNVNIPFPEGYKPYGGSQWWSLTGKCIDFIIKANSKRNILYEFSKSTYIPDEMFFQTLLMNSPFHSTVTNDNLRYIDWVSGPERPRILRSDDLTRLKSSKKLFARKFDDEIDSIRYLLFNQKSN